MSPPIKAAGLGFVQLLAEANSVSAIVSIEAHRSYDSIYYRVLGLQLHS